MPGFKNVFVSGLTEHTTVAKDQLGDIRFVGNKIYKYITYSHEAAAVDGVAGEVCYYVDDTGYEANDVTSDLSAAGGDESIGAGVLQANMADNEFGWIQIKGAATLTIGIVAGADGQPLTPLGAAASDGSLDLVDTDIALGHVCALIIDKSDDIILCDFPF